MLLHPIVVHFAIALLAAAVFCDFLYLITRKETFWQMAGYLLSAGTLCSIAAVLTGNQAFELVEVPPELKEVVEQHRNSGNLTMWTFVALTLLRFVFIRFRMFRRRVKWAYYALALLAAGLLFRTGTLGGDMVYKYGIGVQDQSRPPATSPAFEE